MRLKALLHRTPFWRPLLHGGLWRLPPSLGRAGGKGQVLLSFDDGPTEASLAVAQCLEAHGARGLFCVVGGALPENPAAPATAREARALAIVKTLQRQGHGLAVHGRDHARLGWRSPMRVGRELAQAAHRLEEATGLRPAFQRPPYGSWAPWLGRASRGAGLLPFFWSLNAFDYRASSPQAIVTPLLALARAGDILLLHCSGPGQAHTLAALPPLLEGLKARNLQVLDPGALLECLHA